MKKLRVMALMDEELVPPDTIEGLTDEEVLNWKTEYDVCQTLRELKHDVLKLGVSNDTGVLREALLDWKPDITFNLLEEFHGVAVYDQHVASYLELMKQPYTGCNPRGLMLAHDKVLCKQILQYHRIPTPLFTVYELGNKITPPKKMKYPLFVKSATEDASFGLSKKSIVHDAEELVERVQFIFDETKTDALVEEYIVGREFYVGVLGNNRITTLPIWELLMTKLPKGEFNIATEQVKWDYAYQKKMGVKTEAPTDLSKEMSAKIVRLCKRIYKALFMTGYARMDLRVTEDGRIYVLEANPNPNLSYGEDFAESAHVAGIEYGDLIQKILALGLNYRPAWRV
ncbi:MAG TPA: ATP-grasp domain-containing protein [Pirellulaceae bacterium]|nr:ATP-grasp domain-containing protein [Planctomycetaceae bacterium]HRX79161.1 ATP-grasp domain-containing protein [Pirellulaceae bacterium]